MFTADFETTTDINDCRVWAWAMCEIGNPENFIYGNSIDTFLQKCTERKNLTLYFHNLKFDASFILWWLLKNGYEYIKDKKEKRDKTFTCLINEMGAFYSMEIFFKVTKNKVNKVTIFDSLKILNFSVEKIAKDFDLPIRKLDLDYNKKREIGHELTRHEIDYIRNDVEIMARALKICFDMGLTKMTIASDALHNYKELNKNFLSYFPALDYEVDENIRRSYKGGFTYLSPKYKEKEAGRGIVLDVNSLYPSVMKNEKLPIGEPVWFEGEYKKDLLYPLYVQTLSCSFKIKKDMIPTIQIKGNLSFIPNEYLEDSHGDIVTLTLTNVDLDLFFKHYEVFDLTFFGGYKFKGVKGIFNKYIDFWSAEKIKAKKEGNGARYLVSKLMMNSLYGKYGANPNVRTKRPYLSDDEVLKFEYNPREIGKTIYIPVATFITSYARRKTIETSQAIRDYTMMKYNKDYYIYSDTDSIHMLYMKGEELSKFVDVDDYRLGAWKIESEFIKGKYLRQKCYIEQSPDGVVHSTIAGLPKKLSKIINFDNFKIGFTTKDYENEVEKIGHKLRYKYTRGGVVLVDTDFKIK